MRLFHWFARLVKRSCFVGFLHRKGATPVAHMAPRFALDVAIWATGISLCCVWARLNRYAFAAGTFNLEPETIRV